MSHIIRLRGFWSMTLEGGKTTHSRRFGRPRLPDQTERVWLSCSTLPALVQVRLNGELIATTLTSGSFAADVTDRLQDRNTVSFTIPANEHPDDVALEIRRPMD